MTLLWDCSGSMGSSDRRTDKAALARLAAVAFHEALNKAHVVHEVLGFNSVGGTPEGLVRAVGEAGDRGEDLDRYSRLEDIDNLIVFASFGQADGRAICEITGAASNRDGEAVLWAARRLAQRLEPRKILIVGSDGQPQGGRFHRTEQNYLRETVRRVTSAGIEVIGLGIMDQSVKQYYEQWVLVQDIRDLPKAVLGQITNLLLNRKGTRNGIGRQALR